MYVIEGETVQKVVKLLIEQNEYLPLGTQARLAPQVKKLCDALILLKPLHNFTEPVKSRFADLTD